MNFDLIKQLELELSDPSTRKDNKRVAELIADDFQEVGSSGRLFSKSEIMQELAEEEGVEFSVQGFRFVALSEKCVLVRYETVMQEKHAHRSSIWVLRNNAWQIIHHQGTPFNQNTE